MVHRLGIIIVAVAAAAGSLFDPVTGSVPSAGADESVVRSTSVRMATAPNSSGTSELVVPALESDAGVSAIERTLSGATTPTRKKGTVARRVYYKRLGINLPIVQSPRSGKTREGIAYHHRTSGWPGSGRSTYLYGHARAGTFIRLWQARKGDVIYLTLKNGKRLKYKVYAKIRVRWYDRTYIYKRREMLALQTCVGRNPKGPRLMVLAKPVKGH